MKRGAAERVYSRVDPCGQPAGSPAYRLPFISCIVHYSAPPTTPPVPTADSSASQPPPLYGAPCHMVHCGLPTPTLHMVHHHRPLQPLIGLLPPLPTRLPPILPFICCTAYLHLHMVHHRRLSTSHPAYVHPAYYAYLPNTPPLPMPHPLPKPPQSTDIQLSPHPCIISTYIVVIAKRSTQPWPQP